MFESLKADLESVETAHGRLEKHHEVVVGERNALRGERDAWKLKLAELLELSDSHKNARDRLQRHHDVVVGERDVLKGERDAWKRKFAAMLEAFDAHKSAVYAVMK